MRSKWTIPTTTISPLLLKSSTNKEQPRWKLVPPNNWKSQIITGLFPPAPLKILRKDVIGALDNEDNTKSDTCTTKTTGLASVHSDENRTCSYKPNFHKKPSRESPTILLRDTYIPTKQDLKGNFELKRKYEYDKKMRMDAKYAHDKRHKKQTNNLTLESVTTAAIKSQVESYKDKGSGDYKFRTTVESPPNGQTS